MSISAGTSQDSLFFYARLFGLLTPQASLAVVAALMLVVKLPVLWLSARPMALYARLSSLEVHIVNRLTDTEWMIKVQPATANDSVSSRSKDGGSSSSTGWLPLVHQAADADGKEHQPQLAKDDLDQRLEVLLAEVTGFANVNTSSTGVTTGASSSGGPAASAARPSKLQESQGGELLAKLLLLGSDYSACSAAVGTSSYTAGRAAMKATAEAAAKLAAAAELVLNTLNSISHQRYVLVRVDSEDVDDDEEYTVESADAEADVRNDVHSDHDAEEEISAAAAFRAKVQEKLATQAQLLQKEQSNNQQEKQQQQQQQQKGKRDPAQTLPLLTNKLSLQDAASDELKRHVMKQLMKKAPGQLPRERRARTFGWLASAEVPTAQDAVAQWLLFLYGVLSELVPAGAFVATGGNAAAAAVASCCCNALAETMNDVASQRSRQQVRQALGADWLLWLQPLQPSENTR
jgi:hypothetical protein